MKKYFRWVGHVACTGGIETHTGFRWGNLKRQLGRPSHRWEDIKRFFKNDDGTIWTGLIWLL
jgi:hypothetical protein